jgi:hypothetical protein
MCVVKTTAGEWWLIFGVVSLLLAALFAVVLAKHMPRIEKLRAEGVVAQATVLGKSEQTRHYRSSKGRDKTTTDKILSVSYSSLSTQRFADLKPGAAPEKSTYSADITHDMVASGADFERYKVGDTLVVVYLANRSFEPEFGGFVRDYQPAYQIVFALFATILGA